MRNNFQYEQALEFHIKLDKKWGLSSPNKTWPDFMVEYFNKKFSGKEVNNNEL